jgi:transposase
MIMAKKKILSDFTEEEYREFKRKKLTQDEIAEKLFVSRDTLLLWVRENGLTGIIPKTKYSEETQRKIVEMYNSGMRICDVARAFGCSEHAVRTYIKKDRGLSDA